MREPIVRVLLPFRIESDKQMEENILLNFPCRFIPSIDEYVEFDAAQHSSPTPLRELFGELAIR